MILLRVGASLGAIEVPRLARKLAEAGHEVKVELDGKTRLFVGSSSFSAVGARVVERATRPPDADVDAVVYFPATTETVARLSHGLLPEETPPKLRLVVPEIDPASANNPAVSQNLAALAEDGVRIITDSRPEAVALEVLGGVAESGGLLAGRRVVVTAGGTHEPIDSVRFIGNRSSGKMGLAVAREARLLGAAVTVVAANISERMPGVTWVPVESVSEMERAVHAAIAGADVLVMAAAVSDFTPNSVSEGKIRRGENEIMTMELTATNDILAGLQGKYPGLAVVGFAATHGDPVPDARDKLRRKGADFVVGNDISREDIGFGTDENEVVIVGKDSERFVNRAAKSDVAHAILVEVAAKLSG